MSAGAQTFVDYLLHTRNTTNWRTSITYV